MISFLASYFWGEDEIKADPKVLRQKYLVLQQIKDHRIRLKNPKTNKIKLTQPLWINKIGFKLP